MYKGFLDCIATEGLPDFKCLIKVFMSCRVVTKITVGETNIDIASDYSLIFETIYFQVVFKRLFIVSQGLLRVTFTVHHANIIGGGEISFLELNGVGGVVVGAVGSVSIAGWASGVYSWEVVRTVGLCSDTFVSPMTIFDGLRTDVL